MSNLHVQDRIFDQAEKLKNGLAILDAAVDQFDSYEKYKPECREASGLFQSINYLGRLVRVADVLISPVAEELNVMIEEMENDLLVEHGAEKGGVV